ncbi:hypothetical protein IRJ41_010968 [Triplophysa rosa]|uniref:Uncharacterized protein n=1 Tax=Triplophysa rosa TaxID=992332 RepID=A0A9W7T323_TRIRA|nr:hypothetical protein IRJ41_010968 [Triplophysa rosa]
MDAIRPCILFFCLLLVIVSAVKNLVSIDDLSKVDYGRDAPCHGLQLLFWFSQQVLNIDQNGILTFNSNFDPTRGDYGFKHFGNKEAVLPTLSQRSYYSVGNLNSPGANALHAYVQEFKNVGSPTRNMDRLIVSVNPVHPNRVYNVYITAHNFGSDDFNHNATREIDSSLIQQIRGRRECIVDEKNNFISTHVEDEEDERCRQFLTQLEYNRRSNHSVDPNCDTLGKFKAELRATSEGNTKLIWKDMPVSIMMTFHRVYITICKNDHLMISNTDENQCQDKTKVLISKLSGTLVTSVPLHAGLQTRLLLERSNFFYESSVPHVCYGPELDDANGVTPTKIKGCDASLQLYTEDGKACARLYIKKTFGNWKGFFSKSWVGFYTDAQKANDEYSRYQYADKFYNVKEGNTKDYYIYKFQSDLKIAPGFQIRFLLDKNYDKVLARTTPWEDTEEVMISPSDCDNIDHKSLSHWFNPEFYYGREFYDANKVLPTKIKGFEASLQLYTKNGKTCARIYIENTFSNWKNDFSKSWVGFYSNFQNSNDDYDTYEYAVKFCKVKGSKDYDIFEYHSSLAIAPGVQIRFLQHETYTCELARTTLWTYA